MSETLVPESTVPKEAKEAPLSPRFEIPRPEPSKVEKDPFQLEREAQGERLARLLEQNHLYYDQDKFKEQVEGDGRYLRIDVVEPIVDESGTTIEMKQRFFKALLKQKDPEKDATTALAFKRQVAVQAFLDEKTSFPVTELLSGNVEEANGEQWALYNWYQKGEKGAVGFLHSQEEMKALTGEHASLAVKAIRALQNHQGDLPADVQAILVSLAPFQNFAGFQQDIAHILSRSVNGVGDYYTEDKKPFNEVIGQRLGTRDFASQADQTIEKTRPIVESVQNRGVHIIHGDFAPNNLFLGDGVTSDKLIALDFEWSGVSQNEILAAVYDFGNLRARAWNNEAFRAGLDAAMIESYAAEGREEVGRTIVALGILRSHLNLAGFFENYVPEKSNLPEQTQRREETEKDIAKAWGVLKMEKPAEIARAA